MTVASTLPELERIVDKGSPVSFDGFRATLRSAQDPFFAAQAVTESEYVRARRPVNTQPSVPLTDASSRSLPFKMTVGQTRAVSIVLFVVGLLLLIHPCSFLCKVRKMYKDDKVRIVVRIMLLSPPKS